MKLKPRFPEHCHLTHFCVQTRFTFSFNPKFVRFQAYSNWATWHGLQNEVPMAKQWAMQGSSKWHPSRKAKCHLAPLDMLRNQYLCLVVPIAPNCEVWNVWTCLTYVWSYSNRFSNHQNMFLTFFYMLMYRMWLLLGNPTLALPTGRVLSSTARRPSPKTSHAWDVSKEIRTKAGFILYCIPKPQSIQTCCWDLLRTCPSVSVKTHTFGCFIFVGSI